MINDEFEIKVNFEIKYASKSEAKTDCDEINNKTKKIKFITQRLSVAFSNKKSLEQQIK